eukprot:2018739-Amphidinium_carterae.1
MPQNLKDDEDKLGIDSAGEKINDKVYSCDPIIRAQWLVRVQTISGCTKVGTEEAKAVESNGGKMRRSTCLHDVKRWNSGQDIEG